MDLIEDAPRAEESSKDWRRIKKLSIQQYLNPWPSYNEACSLPLCCNNSPSEPNSWFDCWTNQNWSYISMLVIPWQKISCGLKSKHPKFFFSEVVWNDDKSTMSSNNEASCHLSCDLSCARLDASNLKKINLSRFQLIRFEAKAAFVRRSENWKVVGLNPSRWCAFYS